MTPSPSPRVSIVIPTRNGASTLPAVLDAIASQRVDWPVEVVAIDSGSTDGTIDLLRSRVDRLIQIPSASFDHGSTRNAGIAQSRGEAIVLLVQDAVPASDRWLAELTAPLFADGADSRIAGAFARQRPADDASAIARHYLERWVAASHEPHISSIASAAELVGLSPMDRLLRCAFDDVCSCVRRSAWEQFPFRSTPIGEDVQWAREVLLAGYQVVYAPRAVVRHSHDRSARDEFRRTYLLHRRLRELFGLRTIPTIGALGHAIASSLALHWRLERTAPPGQSRGLWPALSLAFAWPLGQYLGARSAAVADRRDDCEHHR